MPVSLTEISTAPSTCRASMPIRPPSGVNFTALDKQIEQYLLDLALVTDEIAKTFVDAYIERDAVLGALSRTKVRALSMAKGKIEAATSSSMRPASTLERSRISLIRDKQMAPGGEDIVGILGLFLVQLAEQSLAQDLGEADDRV